MNVILISDSLGLPRLNLSYENTWPIMLMREFWPKRIHVIPFMNRGLTVVKASEIVKTATMFYKPDVMIFQFGIVDCVRRALPNSAITILNKVPSISGVVRKFVKKHHFFLTRIFNFRKVKQTVFSNKIDKIIEISKKNNIKICFLSIAPPGKYLIETTFNVEHDIRDYNDIIKRHAEDNDCCSFLNPYNSLSGREILDADGHHLNKEGNAIVFERILEYLKELVFLKEQN